MPLDGTWLVNTIRKKIRIEAGRAYAVDPWLHMFVPRVEPGMVVLRDIAPATPAPSQPNYQPAPENWGCKERGVKLGKKERRDATFMRSACGCPADTFESKGKCYACREGSNKIAFLGAFNPGQSCKTEFYCDEGLSLQSTPPKALQQVGPPYDRVCGADASKDDVLRLARKRRDAHQDLQVVAGRFLLELAGNRDLRRAILDQDGPRAVSISMRTPGFARLRDQSRASGIDTVNYNQAVTNVY